MSQDEGISKGFDLAISDKVVVGTTTTETPEETPDDEIPGGKMPVVYDFETGMGMKEAWKPRFSQDESD